ncbi:YodC family protein [Paraburkholderia sp. IW21]|uniref:YodC family protein n=1 Tax=Paraburkholderia sp. IW21 TaxID=3242488 RepID=UPI003520A198
MLTATIDAFETQPAARFDVGDVVTLKGGGPRMTVMHAGPVALNPGDWLICEWFDEHGELRREMFARDQVRLEPRSIPAGLVQFQKFVRVARVE